LAISLARLMKTDLDGLLIAAKAVSNGGIICYPTDTVYGLGCDPLNVSAVQNVLRVKGRQARAMPILVRDLESASMLASLSNSARRLAMQFWPGPLTIVQHAQERVPAILAPEGTVGLRSPDHPVCLQLLALCSGALVGTSANKTGLSPALSAAEALKIFGDRVDVILDGGSSRLGIASTVVDLTKDHVSILREGPISKSEILQCLRRREPR